MNKVLQVGQSWFFEEGNDAYLYILLLEEPMPDARICHIALENINISGPQGKPLNSASHLPFSYEAVLNSVTSLRSENESLPDFKEGYQQWKEAFDTGKAGIFTISVSESLEVLKQAFK